MAQKSNSHYVPQPYTNQSVFKSLLNCASEMWNEITYSRGVAKCPWNLLGSWLIL